MNSRLFLFRAILIVVVLSVFVSGVAYPASWSKLRELFSKIGGILDDITDDLAELERVFGIEETSSLMVLTEGGKKIYLRVSVQRVGDEDGAVPVYSKKFYLDSRPVGNVYLCMDIKGVNVYYPSKVYINGHLAAMLNKFVTKKFELDSMKKDYFETIKVRVAASWFKSGINEVKVCSGRGPKGYDDFWFRNLCISIEYNPSTVVVASSKTSHSGSSSSSGKYTWRPRFEWPARGVITSPFGEPRRVKVNGYWRSYKHQGIDIAVPIGTKVRAAASGIVTYVGWARGYGWLIIIKHSAGYETRYAHLSKFLVSRGQKVYAGQVIGLSGNSGRATGPHLHFEIRKDGKPVNPLYYLPRR